jgi:ubiquinone/menaquinone biosynthesis C-methylase UbiE
MNKITNYYVGLGATYLIRLGVDSGLFAALAAHPEGTNADELGDELDFHPIYVEHFLRTAFAVHLLDRDPTSETYRLSPHMDVLLAKPEDFRYIGNLAQLYISSIQDFNRMPELLETGEKFTYLEHEKELFDAVAIASDGLARFLAKAVVPKLPGFHGRDDVTALDIGCGEGGTVVALAKAFPQGRILGIDIEPHSIAKANASIHVAGLEDIAEARLCAAEEVIEKDTFDLITMVQVLHETMPEVRDTILERAYAALHLGGFLVIMDEPYPHDLNELHEAPGTVLTQFTEIFWGSVLLSPEDQKQLIEKAGFNVLFQMIPEPGMICVTVAQRS